MARKYSSTASEAVLTAGINASATTMAVSTTAGWPTSYPFTLIIDPDVAGKEEVVNVTNVTGSTVTMSRGVDSTTGVSHDSGASVKHGVSARDFSEPQVHMDATVAHGATGAVVGTTNTQTLTNKTLTSPTINTPVLTGSGGTLSLPAGPETLVGRATTDTLSNKTLTSPVLNTPSVNGSGGALTLPAGPDTLVGRATTDTLTNKTLSSPTITVAGGTLSLPSGPDTIVGRASSDTLTNKSISGSTNTLSNIANASLTNSSVTIGSTAVSLGGTATSVTGVALDATSTVGGASGTNIAATVAKAPYAMSAGSVNVSLSAASSGTAVVTFPVSRFSVAPIVTATKVDVNGGAVLGLVVQIIAVTASQMTVGLYHPAGTTMTNTVTVHWQAIQMTSGTAAG